MMGLRLFCLFGWLAAAPAMAAESWSDGVVERLAAHFEAASSRLRADDVEGIERFVSRVGNTPGARLAILVPMTVDPARSRFLAARVTELQRHVESLAETAEYRRVSGTSNTDVLWLALVLPGPSDDRIRPDAPDASKPVDLLPAAPAALTAPVIPAGTPASAITAGTPASATSAGTPAIAIAPADIRLGDWVVRGVKHPSQGPISAFVARTAPDSVPREVFERQVDRDLGLVNEISLSPKAGWVVRTEIGWIGQGSPNSDP